MIGEYLQIPGADAPGTPAGFNTAAFLRVRTASDGDQPRAANAVIVAMPGFASVPGHWLYLAAQLVHKASQRPCDAAGTNDAHCRIEVWIVHRRGANLEDTAGLRQARVKKDPALAVNYYFGPSILSADPTRPGKFPLAAPHTLVGRPDAMWQPLTQADLAFVADWGFEVYAGDVDRMIALVTQHSGSKNVFLAGHSQGGGFVSNYAGRKLADGRRGYEHLAGLIFLDGGPSAGATPTPPAERLAAYFSDVSRRRNGTSSVYTMTDGLLGALGGPASYALNSVVGIYYALEDPDSESTMFGPRVVGALPGSPAGDAFLSGLRVTYRARAGLSFDVDPVPGAPGMQNAVLSRLGEGLGQLDFTPVAGTEGSCDPLKPAPPCPPSVAQIDPTKVYRWREGGGDGTAPNRVGKAQWWLSALAYAPTRGNIRPVTASFSASGKKTIDARHLTAYNWYASTRYDGDMQFLGEFTTLSLHDQGVNFDIDKPAIAGVPVYVAHQTTNTTLNNPFPLVTDFTEINKNGVFQTAVAKTTTPFDPAINVSLYFHTDFVSADDTLAAQVTPGKPGASAVSNTLIDWVLAHSTGRATVPTPRQLGVGKMY